MLQNILAKVNGMEITQQDVEAFLERLEPQMAEQYKSPQGQKQILNEIINQRLFLYDAIDRQLDQTEIYKKEMEKARDFILTQMNMNSFLAEREVSEEEIKAHYEENPARFDTPQMAITSHILVDNKALCQDLRQKITEKEISFEDAARKYSQCPSSQNGGNLGKYAKGQMVPEYDNAAFELDIDQISQPVQTQFGFHLIKMVEKFPSASADFDQAKNDVKKDLQSLRQRNAYIQKVNEMRKKYPVELLC
jgi:peptidyl-prolyl cis-trans isomerase C